MVTLPKDWKDKIQLRDWMSPINEISEIAILIFAMRNTDGYWDVQKQVKVSKLENLDKSKVLEDTYKKFIYELPYAAASQENVIRFEDGKETIVPITDNEHWEIIEMVDLKFFKPVDKNV